MRWDRRDSCLADALLAVNGLHGGKEGPGVLIERTLPDWLLIEHPSRIRRDVEHPAKVAAPQGVELCLNRLLDGPRLNSSVLLLSLRGDEN